MLYIKDFMYKTVQFAMLLPDVNEANNDASQSMHNAWLYLMVAKSPVLFIT